MPEPRDYRDTVFLPKTDFPMKAGLARKEPDILARWERIGLYEKLRAARKGRERFILHDGPPYANGDIHIGHAMMKTIKDFIVRSQTLMGKDAPFIPGWDCHGLPIEWKIEEQYRKLKKNKDEVPAAEFRAECRAYAEKWVEVQSAQFQRLGILGDWADPYRTMDFASEAAIVGELLKFAESGQLYRGAKPVMWSPVEKTALAEAEVEYEDIVSTQIDVAFEIVESPIPELVGAHAVVWTTTPWTIPVNQAIAYGDDVGYEMLSIGERRWIVATPLIESFLYRLAAADPSRVSEDWEGWKLAETRTLAAFKGSQLIGSIARHPMHRRGGFFAKPRPFLPGDFVTTDQGTGLVHMAPDHGEDDFILCKANGIEPVFAVEGDGKYRADWAWLGGQGSVINPKFNAPEGPICADLREAGALLAASADYKHSYPHSWRSKAKVIFRATPQWFVAMDRQTPSASLALGTSPVNGGGSRAADPPAFTGEVARSAGGGNAATLRELALDAIEHTRWIPARAQNRITAMVEGRPDWVLSRQRAWGVPIALYVNRRTGDYLVDRQVNARIVAAFTAGGADAWFTADHAEILGPSHALADYEPVTDILDVWFDSGSTHAFVIEARYGANPDGSAVRADLYCEGSDQHRGWFQSSLLESCGTRGRAPFAAVLTHGFALDAQGKKMSKSIGNVVDPLKVIEESGADILRMWVAGSDYFDDIRIGKDVLAGASDQYRKLRNTFRYLLGALDGFADTEALPVAEMPELERFVLHLLAKLDAELRAAADAFEFNRYLRALTDFANEDLSAFFFDIRKDSLYCDAPADPKRRACRTVLDILFHALVRYAAPIIPFTAEEVWQARYPSETGSVHVLEWPRASLNWVDDDLQSDWSVIRKVRSLAFNSLERKRDEKVIRSSLEASVRIEVMNEQHWPAIERKSRSELSEAFIVADVTVTNNVQPMAGVALGTDIERTAHHKCGRCWRHLPEVTEDGTLCARCKAVVAP